MNLDVRTMLVVHAMVATAPAALKIAFLSWDQRMPGLALWALGTVLLGVGIFGGALRGMIPDFLSILVANCLGVGGLSCFWNGLRAFDGRPQRWAGSLLAVAATAPFLVYRTYVVDDIISRIIVLSVVLAAICSLCACELLRGPARTLRGAPA